MIFTTHFFVYLESRFKWNGTNNNSLRYERERNGIMRTDFYELSCYSEEPYEIYLRYTVTFMRSLLQCVNKE